MSWFEDCSRMDAAVISGLAAAVGVILAARRGYDAAREQAASAVS